MNIFIIPSWYPGRTSSIAGIFVKEQTEALADIYPEHNFIVSFTENFFISITEIKKAANVFNDFKNSETFQKKISENLLLLYKPVITWTEKLGGEIKNIIKAQTENFLEAKKISGSIDLIHAHVSYPAGYAAMELSEKFSVPFIITEHMAPFPFTTYLNKGKLSEKISAPIEKADRVISVSKFSANEIKSYGLQDPAVIPNLVNEDIFFPDYGKVNKDKVKFLTVATFNERKGIKELMECILFSTARSEKCIFTIAGTGEMDLYIEKFIFKNNLQNEVTLIKDPSRDLIAALYRECDVFILPSRDESFGIVYIEAMASGKPVVATDCGGPSDFVTKENGLIVEVGNSKQLSDAVRFMEENINSYDPKVIRQYFMENFSRRPVCAKIMSEYEDVLHRN